MKRLIILLISTVVLVIVYISFTNLDFSADEISKSLEMSKPFSGRIDLDYLKQVFETSQSETLR